MATRMFTNLGRSLTSRAAGSHSRERKWRGANDLLAYGRRLLAKKRADFGLTRLGLDGLRWHGGNAGFRTWPRSARRNTLGKPEMAGQNHEKRPGVHGSRALRRRMTMGVSCAPPGDRARSGALAKKQT